MEFYNKHKKAIDMAVFILVPFVIVALIYLIIHFRKKAKDKNINAMPLLYENNIPNNKEAFIQKVKDISKSLNINPNWIMFVMNNESDLKPDAENKSFPFLNGFATGLIQFTPDTAAYLGTTTSLLKTMTNVDQLDYVYKYLLPMKSKLHNIADVYNAVFFPVAVGKPADFVLSSKNLSAEIIAKSNPIFDLNKDKQITVGEIKQYIINKLPIEYKNLV